MRPILLVLFNNLLLLANILVLSSTAGASESVFNGSNLVALFVRAEQLVEFRSLEGELISSVAVPDNSHTEEQLYPVLRSGAPAVLALKTRGKRELGTATLFSAEGRVGALGLGSLRDSFVFGYDLNGDGDSDLVTVDRIGRIRILWGAFTNDKWESKYRIKKKAFDGATLTYHNNAPALVILRVAGASDSEKTGAEHIRFADIYPLGSDSRLKRIRTAKLRGELRPLVLGNSFVENRFLLVDRASKRIRYGTVNLNDKKFKRHTSSLKASFFPVSFNENSVELVVSDGGVLNHFDASDGLTLLSRYDLVKKGGYPPGQGDQGNPGGSGPCVSELPVSLLSQIAAAYNSNNFPLLSQLINQIAWGQLCPQTSYETYQALAAIIGQAKLGLAQAGKFFSADSFKMLEAPFRSPRAAQVIRSCDVLRPSKDGPGGFVYKTGEKDGKVAVLLPSSIYSSAAWLANLKGKNIENLKHDGRTNGWRDTYRAKKTQNQYPRRLIVKARVNTGYGEEKNYCWILDNSHIRND